MIKDPSNQSKRLKILFFPAWYPSTENPVHGIYVKEHAKAVSLFNDVIVVYNQSAINHDGDLIHFASDGMEDGIRTIRTRHKKRYPRAIRQIIDTWKLFGVMRQLVQTGWIPDIIHAHVFLSGIPAIIVGRWYQIPVIMTEHWGAFVLNTLKRINIWEARFVMNRAKIILPVSNDLKKAIKSFGIHNQFEVVPNTVKTDVSCDLLTNQNPGKYKRMLSVALLKPVKGVDYLIQALSKLKNMRQDFRLDIVGDGPKKLEYQALAKRLGLGDIIKFHGLKNKSEVVKYMGDCDFYVQAGLSETFGVTFIEAMACGKPIVATDLPALREKIDDSRGVLVPPKNVDALANALDVMLDHYQDYSAKEIARYVQNNFSYETVGLKLTHLYHEMLGRSYA